MDVRENGLFLISNMGEFGSLVSLLDSDSHDIIYRVCFIPKFLGIGASGSDEESSSLITAVVNKFYEILVPRHEIDSFLKLVALALISRLLFCWKFDDPFKDGLENLLFCSF